MSRMKLGQAQIRHAAYRYKGCDSWGVWGQQDVGSTLELRIQGRPCVDIAAQQEAKFLSAPGI